MLTIRGLENLSKESAEFIYKFTFHASNLLEKEDIENIGKIILEKRVPKFIYLFAREMKPKNVDLFMNALVELKAYEYFTVFANTIPGADIYYLASEIQKCDDPAIITEFSEFVIEKRKKELDEINKNLAKKINNKKPKQKR